MEVLSVHLYDDEHGQNDNLLGFPTFLELFYGIDEEMGEQQNQDNSALFCLGHVSVEKSGTIKEGVGRTTLFPEQKLTLWASEIYLKEEVDTC